MISSRIVWILGGGRGGGGEGEEGERGRETFDDLGLEGGGGAGREAEADLAVVGDTVSATAVRVSVSSGFSLTWIISMSLSSNIFFKDILRNILRGMEKGRGGRVEGGGEGDEGERGTNLQSSGS